MQAPTDPREAGPDIVRAFVDRAATRPHPRLLVSLEEFEAVRALTDGADRRVLLRDAVVAQAEALLQAEPIQREKVGRRLLGKSRECVKRVLTLATAYRVTGRPEFRDRCRAEMLAAAAFSDWNPSHFLDVAELTFALGVGYDWLYDDLDADARDTIRGAILEKGLNASLKHTGWVRAGNNWGQVCHGGITTGALAIAEDQPELAADITHRALHNVLRSVHESFAPAGTYPEGPGYWEYGTTYNVLLIAVLDSATGTDFGLANEPGFAVTAEFLNHATGPSGAGFNYADGGAGMGISPAMHWFARRYERPDWLLFEYPRLDAYLQRAKAADGLGGSNRFLPLALFWTPETTVAEPIRMPLARNGIGPVPVAMFRTSWTDPNATFLGFKAGSPSASHGHMDGGSFVVEADGVRWGVDLGAEGYHGIESRGMNLWTRDQDGDRWKIFRLANFSHSTLVMDGELQRSDGNAPMVRFSEDPAVGSAVADLTSLYKGRTERALREARLLPNGEVLIRDGLEGVSAKSVRWGMMTQAKVVSQAGNRLVLGAGDARFSLEILRPAGAVWQVVDASKPANEWDSPNGSAKIVCFESAPGADGDLRMAVLMTPGSCTGSAKSDIDPDAPLIPKR